MIERIKAIAIRNRDRRMAEDICAHLYCQKYRDRGIGCNSCKSIMDAFTQVRAFEVAEFAKERDDLNAKIWAERSAHSELRDALGLLLGREDEE